MVLTNVRYFVGPADLTSYSNKVEVEDTLEEKDATNFGSAGAKELLAGLESIAFQAEGQWNAGDPGYPDDSFWASRRTVEAHSVAPIGTTVGNAAYTTQAVRTSAKLFGTVGDVAPWALSAVGSWPMARGMVVCSPGTAVTTTGTGTSVTLGAVSDSQRLYASLHVLSVTGTSSPTIAVTIQSDDNAPFGTPTSRLTFTTTGSVGSESIRGSLGAITDTFYRCSFTVTGTNPSFLALVVLGIAG